MSNIPFVFPHPLSADSDGLLCFNGDLHPQRLLLAYQFGIFPWYSADQPLMWWFISPRLVVFPDKLKVSKSMRNILNRKMYRVTFDTAFAQVIQACRNIPRAGQLGTWITDEMQAAYNELHDMGHAHSVEVWQGEELVGGLYGISLGKIFYGESMFSTQSNVSKVAFIHLVRRLGSEGFTLVDCQQDTPHLRTLGAELINEDLFMAYLRKNALVAHKPGSWSIEK